MSTLKDEGYYAAKAPEYAAKAAGAADRNLFWMGLSFWSGVVSMITSIAAFYMDSQKVGFIAFVVMTFCIIVSIIYFIEYKFAAYFPYKPEDNNKESDNGEA